ncbi:MAG: deoxyribonuclease V [Anaerolineae bacterium]|nr:deoxyribonuclease V [Anaerolineae bacterium]
MTTTLPDVTAAIAEQRRLAQQVRAVWDGPEPQVVVGVDMAGGLYGADVRAAAVALSWPSLEGLAVAIVEQPPTFPYVPGLLALREAPAVLAALQQLKLTPDLLMVDGQGIAHPRRCGIATYLGVTLNLPTIGVAKSRLVGIHAEPGPQVGDWTPLLDGAEVIGAVLRTRLRANPLYISVGHRVDLRTALRFVLAALRGYRLPEPTRQADRASKGKTAT